LSENFSARTEVNKNSPDHVRVGGVVVDLEVEAEDEFGRGADFRHVLELLRERTVLRADATAGSWKRSHFLRK
jgi:hypothetical protein